MLIFLIAFLHSCKINVGDGDNENEGGINTEIPPIPMNVFPVNSDTGISITPQLMWNCNSNNMNLRYEVYLDYYNPPSNFKGITYTTSYTITEPLAPGTTYYWKIKAINENNNNSSESGVWYFKTSATGSAQGDSLIAYYPFKGNANDESGKGHDGINYGAILTNDRFYNIDQAYNFNGSNSYIGIWNSPDLQPTTGITLSVWFNFATLNNTVSLISKGTGTSSGLYNIRYNSSSGTMDFTIIFSDNTLKTLSTSMYFMVNQWYNVIATYDGSTMKIYLEGTLYNSTSVYRTLGSNTNSLLIGTNFEGYYFKGSLDDIRLFDYALSENEIQLLYHEGGWK